MIGRSHVVGIATVLVLCAVVPLPPGRQVSPVAAAVSTGRAWLALGDSYSAGTGIDGPLDSGGPGRDCRRADGKAGHPRAWAVNAYEKVKQNYGLSRIDFVPCNGAITDDAFKPGPGIAQSMEAQYLNVPGVPTGSRKWDVVSFTFGGNNLGFSDVLRGCVDAFENWLEADRNPGCDIDQAALEKRVDQLTDTPHGTTGADLVGSVNIPTLLDDVTGLVNPNGQAIMVGYPRLVRDPFLFGGPLLCEGLNRDGYTMLNSVVDHLNKRLSTAIDAANDRHSGKKVTFDFVNAADEIDGHELCSKEPWVTGITLQSSIAKGIDFATSFHPNQKNHNAIAEAVAAKVDLPRPALDAQAPAPATNRYSPHFVERYGFSTELPSDFIQQDPSDNRDGLTFTSADGRSEVRIYGSNNLESKTPQAIRDDFASYARADGGVVTFQTIDTKGVTVTGTIAAGEQQIFYYRIFVGPGSINVAYWRYPTAQKDAYDEPVAHSVRSFRIGDLTQSH